MHPLDERDLFAGLTALEPPPEPTALGRGVLLSGTSAKFLIPLTLVNTSPPSPDPLRPRPAFWQVARREYSVTGELFVPSAAAPSFDQRYELARFIVLVLRL